MMTKDFQIGDPAWAKREGLPPWPIKIADAPSDLKPPTNKECNYVFFFGTGDCAWIPSEYIYHHTERMLTEAKSKNINDENYQNGIKVIIKYSELYEKENDSNVTKPKVKVVKNSNSVSKKYKRNVLGKRKSNNKKKTSHCDVNGKSSNYSSSNSTKFKSSASRHFTPSRCLPSFDLYSPEQNEVIHTHEIVHPEYSTPSRKRFGFIGLGMMGRRLVKNLLESGHDISVWSETAGQCDTFVEMGAEAAKYPADLIITCDITFCCVSDPEASKAVIFSENGVLNGLEQAHHLKLKDRGYVDLNGIDPLMSQKTCEAVLMKHGMYLEASLCGTSRDAEEGNLLVLAAGDKKLFAECETCFLAIGKHITYISCQVGDASKMKLILNTFRGTICAALSEAMVLVERLQLPKSHFLGYLKNGFLPFKNIMGKAQEMNELALEKVTALKYVQKDISLALTMAGQYSQSMPMTTAAYEVFEDGLLGNISNTDMSAVFRPHKWSLFSLLVPFSNLSP